MKTIILAGGFASRMWPLTREQPKSLLPIAGRPMISHIIDRLKDVLAIDEIIISTNKRFETEFLAWLRQERKTVSNLSLIIEETLSETEKLGAVGGLNYVLTKTNLIESNEDVLVIAGDNLFEFDLLAMIEFQRENGAPVMAFHDLQSLDEVRGKYGVAILDEDNIVKDFQEKPTRPKSTLVSTGIYLLPSKYVKSIPDYLSNNDPDDLGHFFKWLSKQNPVKGYVFDGSWYDIGSFSSYTWADQYYKLRNGTKTACRDLEA